MKFLLTCPLMLGLMIFTSTGLAWNAKGHVLITQIAQDELSQKAKEALDRYTEILTRGLPILLQQQLEDSYTGASTFAKLSPLPDRWRDLSLQKIFDLFEAPLPDTLHAYRNQLTSTWHFVDKPFPENPHCFKSHQENIWFAINLLNDAWQNSQDERSKAVLLLLITHFIEDAHQPLHMLSHTTRKCRQDAGGNKRFILTRYHRVMNLHQWWDGAGGYWSHRAPFNLRAKELMQEFTRRDFGESAQDLNLTDWTEEAFRYAPFIYSARANQALTARYKKESQQISRERMTLAGYRLAYWMNTHL